MSMNEIPTLIIGVGGIGCKIAGELHNRLSDEDRRYVGVIGIDTNINDLCTIRERYSIETILLSDDTCIDDYFHIYPETRELFPEKLFHGCQTLSDGAGQLRALSRFAFLSSEAKGRLNPIIREMNRIRRVDDNPFNSTISVIVIGTLAGGTGSGILLQLPFYLRKIAKPLPGLKCIFIRGMFIGSDIMADKMPSKSWANSVCANGYACLRELNAFYLRASMQSSRLNNLRLEFFDHEDSSVNNIPYDYMYLFEKTSSMYDCSINDIIDLVSRTAFTLLNTIVARSEPHIIEGLMLMPYGINGMDRYDGAGLCTLVYPQKLAQEYAVLSAVKEQFGREWTLIDRHYEAIHNAAISKCKTGSTVELPKRKEMYIELFRKETIGSHPLLGALAPEAYVERDGELVSRAAGFVDALDSMIDALIESSSLSETEDSCRIDDRKMLKFSEARVHLAEVWESMRDYNKRAEHLVKINSNELADKLFPADEKAMAKHRDEPGGIIQLLSGVHPVTARFLIYDLIARLEGRLEKLKRAAVDVDLWAYTTVDFDPKEEGTQGPLECLERIRRRQFFGIPLGDRDNVHQASRAFQRLMEQLHEVTENHISTTRKYVADSLKYSVSKLIIGRLEDLSRGYDRLFSAAGNVIENNDRTIERIENMRFPFGQKGIYCSKEALREMAEEFRIKCILDLTDEAKTTISDQVFRLRFIDAPRTEPLTSNEKLRIADEEDKKLRKLFEDTVISYLRTRIEEAGERITNFTAKEALIKEFELSSGLIPEDYDYDSRLQEYVQDRIDDALRAADPMISIETKYYEPIISFAAVSPANAVRDDNGRPDPGETVKFYIPYYRCDPPHALIASGFKDTELTFMRLLGKFPVEKLVNYKEGSQLETAYNEQIERFCDLCENKRWDQIPKGDRHTPHLLPYWHEEGMLPSLYKAQRERAHIDSIKTFILTMGFKFIMAVPRENANDADELEWVPFIKGHHGLQAVKKCGKRIGGSYHELFDAIPYNRRLKSVILSAAQEKFAEMKGNKTAEELYDGILENDFFRYLTQPTDANDKNSTNLLDVFMELETNMLCDELKDIFTVLLSTLWKIGELLFDKDVVYINKATKLILNEILKNSCFGNKPESELTLAEENLMSRYKDILGMEYEGAQNS